MYESYNIRDIIEDSKKNAQFSISKTSIICKIDGNQLPLTGVFEKYLKILKREENSVLLELNDKEFLKYKYKPKLLSNRIYGTPDLWHLIMVMNNIVTATNFNKRTLLIFKPSKLRLLSLILNNERKYLKVEKEYSR